MTNKSIPRVVIVGSGFAGLTAARRIARLPVHVTVVDRKNHHTFQPLLYQVATAGLSPGEIAAPIRWILRSHSNVQVLLEEVLDFNLEQKKVLTKEQVLDYDFLIIASGATHAYFGHEEWEPLAPGLKTIEDALEIRRRVLLACWPSNWPNVGTSVGTSIRTSIRIRPRMANPDPRYSLRSSEADPPASNSRERWLRSRVTH